MTITRERRTVKRLTDPDRYDLGRLSYAERLWLWRHRHPGAHATGKRKHALTQREAAARFGLRIAAYLQLENGERTRLNADEIARLQPALVELAPTTGELCFLARRRSGRTLNELEVALLVSRPTLLGLERAGDPRVVWFWREVGFRFPP